MFRNTKGRAMACLMAALLAFSMPMEHVMAVESGNSPAVTETAAEKPAEGTPEKPEEKPAEGTPDKPAEGAPEKPEEKPAEGTPDKPAEGTPEKPEEKPAEGTPEKPEEKPAEGTPEKPEEKPAEGTPDKPIEGTPEKPAEVTPDKPIEKPTEDTAGETADETAGDMETQSPEAIAEAVYGQLEETGFEAVTTRVEDALAAAEENTDAELAPEKLLDIVKESVAACLTELLEQAKEEYAALEQEETYQAVYDSLYERILRAVEGLFGFGQDVETYSLLPLTEKELTPDLTGLTPAEMTMVPFDKIFAGETMSGVTQIAYMRNSDDDDYVISKYPGTANMSQYTYYNSSTPWLMIPGGDQLDAGAVRYVVEPQYTASREWLVPMVYVQDAEGNRAAKTVYSYDYYDGSENPDLDVYLEDASDDEAYYLKLSLNDTLYPASSNRASVKIYEGNYETAEEAQVGKEITEQIFGEIDMTAQDAGYAIHRYGNDITILTFDDSGEVTGCLPMRVDLGNHSTRNELHTYYPVKRVGDTTESVAYRIDPSSEGSTKTYTAELYDGYAVNDIYHWEMYYNSVYNDSAVTAAYVGGYYASIAEASGAGAVEVKDALFGNGYAADYSKGVLFSIFVGADGEGQEVYHYCLKTKAGSVLQDNKSSSVAVHFTGLKDENKNVVACYEIKQKDDSYADGNYPTLVVPGNVDLENLRPVFTTDRGAVLKAAGKSEAEKSGESLHDFSKGAVHYTTVSERQEDNRDVWLSVVREEDISGRTYNLYTNSLSDVENETRIENGVIYSKREVILENTYDSHDIFLINMGTNVIPKLSVELSSDVLQIDEYWTLNGNHDLAAFSGTTDTTNYGELANLAKVRLKMKEGVTSGKDVEGTLTVKADGTPVMVFSLTGIAGAPVIVTDSIPEAVKYVPYGPVIQSSNKYNKTKVEFGFGGGTLPAGMQIMKSGEIYGVPQEAGSFRFGVKMVTTNPNSSMTKIFTLVVKENTDANVNAATDTGYRVTQRIPTVAIGADGSHVFVSQGVLDEFTDVYLDGEKLVKDVDYTAESGSTRLTISSQTLTRSNTTGTHTLGAEFRTSGEHVLKAAAQNFKVVAKGANTGNGGSSGGSGNSGGSENGGGTGGNAGGSGNGDSAGSNTGGSGSGNSGSGNGAAVRMGAAMGTAQGTGLAAAADAQPVIYTVASGDTLSKIALRHYGSASLWRKIYEDNRDVIGNPDRIRAGMQIKIYPTGTAGQNNTPANVPAGRTADAAADGATTYIVQKGDTLWKIAYKVYGRGWQWRRIYNANRDALPKPGQIREGQVLVIPSE